MTKKEIINIVIKVFGLYAGTVAINSLIQLIPFLTTPNETQDYQNVILVSILIKMFIYLGLSLLLIFKTKIVLSKIDTEKIKNNDNQNSSIAKSNDRIIYEDLLYLSLKIIGLIFISLSISNLLSAIYPAILMFQIEKNWQILQGFFSQFISPFSELIIGIIIIQTPKWLMNIMKSR